MSHLEDVVLFDTRDAGHGYKIGVATLNSERSLNALSIDMVEHLEPQLKAWAEDDTIVCVWLQGAGEKAFCAGGDIVSMYNAAQAKPGEVVPEVVDFFTREYQLDYQLQTYPKPIVVWGDGFVMGGGLGLMIGASHRIVTERSRLAMPEISIGLYPDVGGTYFLSRLPEGMGLFLGLTAAQVNAKDACWLGMADFALNAEQKESALHALCAVHWTDSDEVNRGRVSDALAQLADYAHELPEPALQPHYETIKELMSGDSIHLVAEQFLNADTNNKMLSKGQQTLAAGCPLTAHIVWQQLAHGPNLSLAEAFQLELTLSVNCAVQGDFIEGVRALLIDKDRNPRWQHTGISEVTEKDLDAMFRSPWSQEEHPLRNLGNQ